MEKLCVLVARCAVCIGVLILVVVVSASLLGGVRAEEIIGVPPGGNGTTCQNWNNMGQRQCDPNECYMAPINICSSVQCRNNGVLPCKVCNCKPFTWPTGDKSCECQD